MRFNILPKAIALALTMGSIGAANADVWRMAHKMPSESIEGQMFQAVADRIGETTDGEVTVQVYPSEQLGADDAILEQLQLGTVQIYPEGSPYLQKWIPEIRYTESPFLFEDRAHWVRFMNSDLVNGWMDQIEDDAGIVIMGDQTKFVRGPYRVLLSESVVKDLDDVQGLKLRMSPNELLTSAWRHLGAEVRTLAWTEVYEGIGRGIIESVTSPISLVKPMRFYEVAPHIARTDEFPQGLAFMTNADAWNGLNEETRSDIIEAYNQVAEEFQPRIDEVVNEDLAYMEAKGVTYFELDTSPFIERMSTFYDDLNEKGELPEGFMETVNLTRSAE